MPAHLASAARCPARPRPPAARHATLALLLGLPGLAAPPAAAQPAALVFDCGSTRLEAVPEGDGLRLQLEGRSILVRPAPAASGARHTGEAEGMPVEFWDRGGWARLSLGARVLPDCRRAGAPGPYRASGNEPFWALRIEGDTARLDRPGLPPRELRLGPPDATAQGVTREAAPGGPTLRLVIAPGPCRDTMSGAGFPDRVTLELDGARLEGCGASAEGRLLGGPWMVAAIGGAAPDGRAPTLEFRSGGQVFGQGPCNRYRGSWALEGERLAFGPLAASMMACPGPAMASEAALFRALGAVRAHRFAEDGALVIEGADGMEVLARR